MRLRELLQVFSVVCFYHVLRCLLQRAIIYISIAVRDLFRASDQTSRTLLQFPNLPGGNKHALRISRIKPVKMLAKRHYLQFALSEVFLVYIRNFKLSAGGGLQILCNGNDLIVIKVKARYDIMRLWNFRFLLKSNDFS